MYALLNTDPFQHSAPWTEVNHLLDLETLQRILPICHGLAFLPEQWLAHSRVVKLGLRILHNMAQHVLFVPMGDEWHVPPSEGIHSGQSASMSILLT